MHTLAQKIHIKICILRCESKRKPPVLVIIRQILLVHDLPQSSVAAPQLADFIMQLLILYSVLSSQVLNLVLLFEEAMLK